jgi:hypothetical protein
VHGFKPVNFYYKIKLGQGPVAGFVVGHGVELIG